MELIKWIILSFAGSLLPAVVLNVEKRLLLWAGLIGSAGFTTAYILSPNGIALGIMQVFIGAAVVGLLSEIASRSAHAPAINFCIPGIIPLVPGSVAYQAMQKIMLGEYATAASLAFTTVGMTFSIAFGIMLVTAFLKNMPKAVVRKLDR